MEFTTNVWVKEGDLSRSVIGSVTDAIEFLSTWPQPRRGPFFYLAANSLQSALTGSIAPDEARQAFEAFCREAGILADKDLGA